MSRVYVQMVAQFDIGIHYNDYNNSEGGRLKSGNLNG